MPSVRLRIATSGRIPFALRNRISLSNGKITTCFKLRVKWQQILKKRLHKCRAATYVVDVNGKKPHLVSGQYSSTFTYKDAQNEWTEIGATLNAIPGASKDWRHWRKTWQDRRSKAKTKAAAQRSHMTATGGGCANPVSLSVVDETILNIISPTVTDGINVAESLVTIIPEHSNATLATHTEQSSPSVAVVMNCSVSVPEVIVAPASSVAVHAEVALAPASSASVAAVAPAPTTSTATPSHSRQAARNSTPRIIPNAAVKRLKSALDCSTAFQTVAEAKLQMKRKYYADKLALYQQDLAAKDQFRQASLDLQERSLDLQERLVVAHETLACVLQEKLQN